MKLFATKIMKRQCFNLRFNLQFFNFTQHFNDTQPPFLLLDEITLYFSKKKNKPCKAILSLVFV